MRVIFFLIIILFIGYSLMDIMGILTKKRTNEGLSPKQGIERLKIPKELKEEYDEIKKAEIVKFKSDNINNLEKIEIVENKIQFEQNPNFPLKIKDKKTVKSDLYINAYVKNKTNKDYKGKLTMLCQTYDENKIEKDIFTWKGNVVIPSGKVVLINGAKLGYVNLENTKHIRCKVEKYKRY